MKDLTNPFLQRALLLPSVSELLQQFPGFFGGIVTQLLETILRATERTVCSRALIARRLSNGQVTSFETEKGAYRALLQATLEAQLGIFVPLGKSALLANVGAEIANLYPPTFKELLRAHPELSNQFYYLLTAAGRAEGFSVPDDTTIDVESEVVGPQEDFLTCNAGASPDLAVAAPRPRNFMKSAMQVIAATHGGSAAVRFRQDLVPQLIEKGLEVAFTRASEIADYLIVRGDDLPADELRPHIARLIAIRQHLLSCPFPEALSIVYWAAATLLTIRIAEPAGVAEATERLLQIFEGVYPGDVRKHIEEEHVLRIQNLVAGRETNGPAPTVESAAEFGTGGPFDNDLRPEDLEYPRLREAIIGTAQTLVALIKYQVARSTPVETFGVTVGEALDNAAGPSIAAVTYFVTAKLLNNEAAAMRYLNQAWESSKFAGVRPEHSLSAELLRAADGLV